MRGDGNAQCRGKHEFEDSVHVHLCWLDMAPTLEGARHLSYHLRANALLLTSKRCEAVGLLRNMGAGGHRGVRAAFRTVSPSFHGAALTLAEREMRGGEHARTLTAWRSRRSVPIRDASRPSTPCRERPPFERNRTMPTAKPTPGAKLLTPQDHTLIMIDFQSQMAFATKSIDAVVLRNNAALVAHAAAGFGVSTILTTVAEKSFSGPMFRRDHRGLPRPGAYRPHVDEHLGGRQRHQGRQRDRQGPPGVRRPVDTVCIVGPALSAIDQGFEVYVIADACGDVSDEAHDRAMDRMVQAGARR